MPDADTGYRRLVGVALVVCVLGIGVFVVLRLLAPFRSTGVDEAYYLGIGANILAGRGLETVFGEFPAIHSPLWPLVLQGPASWLGVDPETWGDPLVVAFGALVVGLAGWYAWRSIRLAAPLAVAWLIAFPFLIDLAGAMGLDLPSAALAMLYVAVGITAVRRGSFALGLGAGLLLAAAFLVKELALPFAPVPLLAGLVRSVSPASIGRAASGILLAAAAGVSWWFLIYAHELGVVYRLGTPVWTLVPLAVGAIALVVIGLALDRIAPWAAGPLEGGRARLAIRLGWLGALAWAGTLTLYFAFAPNPLGAPFLSPDQVGADLARFGPRIWSLLSVCLTGAVFAVVDRLRPDLLGPPPDEPTWSRGLLRPDERHAVDDVVLAVLCGFPFVLLVVSVGEGPRHYIAHIGFLVALGAIGWTRLLVAIGRRPTPVAIAMLGLSLLLIVLVAAWFPGSSRSLLLLRLSVPLAVVGLAFAASARRTPRLSAAAARIAPATLIASLFVVMLGSAVWTLAAALPKAPAAIDETRAEAVATAVAWVRGHLDPGSMVVFGSGLAMETAIHLVGDYRTAQVTDETGLEVDPAGPLGLTALDGTRADDWVALWPSRANVDSFIGYRAGRVVDTFRDLGPSVWIQTVITADGVPASMIEALERAEGVEPVVRWSWPLDAGYLETIIYRVDPLRLAFSNDVVITPAALERLVDGMEQSPNAYRVAAAALLERAVPIPPDAGVTEVLARLRAIAEHRPPGGG